MTVSEFLNKYFYYIYFGFFGLLAILCFIFVPLTVKADGAATLPYTCQSVNPYYDQAEVANVLDAISQAYPDKYDSNANFVIFLTSEQAWWNNSNNIACKAYSVYQVSGISYTSTWGITGSMVEPDFSNFVLFGDNYIDYKFENCYKYTLIERNIGTRYNGFQVVLDSSTAKSYTRRLFSNYTPVHIQNSKFDFSYYQNYPVYVNNSFKTNDIRGNAGTVLTYLIIDDVTGEFSDLPGIDDLINNISNTWGDSSNNNLPADDSNVSLSENIRNYLGTLQNNITNAINNLGSKLKSYFDNLQQKLTDLGNSISRNIYNGFFTLMQNIKDFLGPKLDAIIQKLNYITEPFSQEELFDYIAASNIFIDYSSISTSITTFLNSFNSVTEPSDYVIPIHIENITYFSSVPTFYLHLNILDPVKNLIRAFLWVVCSYGLIAGIIDSIPNYINGGGDEQ